MKNLFKSVSELCGNPAKFAWQNSAPKSAATEWSEAIIAGQEADKAETEAVDAMLNLFSKKYEAVGEYGDALVATAEEGVVEVQEYAQNQVDKAGQKMMELGDSILDGADWLASSTGDIYNNAVDNMNKVYISAIEEIDAAAKVVAEGVTDGYNATVDAGKAAGDFVAETATDAYDDVAEKVQPIGDFATGVADMIGDATERGRNIRLARESSQDLSNEEVSLANEDLSEIPASLKNIGNNATEMRNNISGAERQSAFQNYFPEEDFSKFKYQTGLTANGNKKLYDYLKANI